MDRCVEWIWRFNAAIFIARVFMYMYYQTKHLKNTNIKSCKTYTKACIDDFLCKNQNETIDELTSEQILHDCCNEYEQYVY